MKILRPQILWHGDMVRVLSIEFHPFMNLIVTGGGDICNGKSTEEDSQLDDIGFIKLWQWFDNPNDYITIKGKDSDQKIPVNFIRSISDIHIKTVNCVRFSPDGQYLASAGDDQRVILSRLSVKTKSISSVQRIVSLTQVKTFVGHNKEVVDLKWSNCGQFIVSGSGDGRVHIWSVAKGNYLQTLEGENKGQMIQGVALDPKELLYIVYMGNDKKVKVYKKPKNESNTFKQYSIVGTIDKLQYTKQQNDQQMEIEDDNVSTITGNKIFMGDYHQILAENETSKTKFNMFLDDKSVFTFVRRPDFSPDGSIFIVPSAVYQTSPDVKTQKSCVYGFKRNSPKEPSLVYFTKNPAIVIKFCPHLFQLPQNCQRILDLNYYMVFAVATVDQVILYNTISQIPIAVTGNIHFTALSDLTWKGASALGISSTDGFCSFITFEDGELGIQLPEEQIPIDLKKCLIKESFYDPKVAMYYLLKDQLNGGENIDLRNQRNIKKGEEEQGAQVEGLQQLQPNLQLKQKSQIITENGRKRIIPTVIERL